MADKPLRIAVTGASGYIAGRIISQIQESDRVERILATDVKPLITSRSPKVKFVRWDVTAPCPDLFVRHEIDAVVHLAYVLNPARREAHARRVNVTGTDSVLEACEKADVRHVLYLSSASVYGAHPDNPQFLTEEDPIRPVRNFKYSEHKAAAESRLRSFAERNSSAVATVLRVCPVMGPNADNFIANAFRKPLLPAIRGADPPMQFIHEDDLVHTLIRCLDCRPDGIYNVAAEGTIRWSRMADSIGSRSVRLPAALWYTLTAAAWRLGLQNDSPARGLDFIRYRWTVSSAKIRSTLGLRFRHTSGAAWESYAETLKG